MRPRHALFVTPAILPPDTHPDAADKPQAPHRWTALAKLHALRESTPTEQVARLLYASLGSEGEDAAEIARKKLLALEVPLPPTPAAALHMATVARDSGAVIEQEANGMLARMLRGRR